MAIAFCAKYFDPLQQEAPIAVLPNVLLGRRSPKAWPSGSGVEPLRRSKQSIPAADTPVQSVLVMFRVPSCVRRFGPFLARDRELGRGKLLPPLLVRFTDLLEAGLSGRLTG